MTKTVSPQRRWQIKQEKNGRCIICGDANLFNKLHCLKHAIAARDLMRKIHGLTKPAKMSAIYLAHDATEKELRAALKKVERAMNVLVRKHAIITERLNEGQP